MLHPWASYLKISAFFEFFVVGYASWLFFGGNAPCRWEGVEVALLPEIMDNELPPSPNAPEPPPPGGPAPAPSQAPSASAPPVLNPPRLPAAPRPKNRGWKIAVGILAVLLLFSLFNNFWYLAHNIIGSPVSVKRQTGPRLEESFIEYRHSPNNILVIAVEGIISSDMVGGAGNYSMVDFMRDQFKMAAEDTDIKAVILKVDSPGGEVLASDEIYHMVRQFQKNTGKPVVASMATVAASGRVLRVGAVPLDCGQ